MSEVMNAREYALHCGVSHVAVHKWIHAGKLGPIGDAVQQKGRGWSIDPVKADAYFRDNARQTMQRLPFDGENLKPASEVVPEGNSAPDSTSKTSAKPGLDTYHGAAAWEKKYNALLAQHKFEIESGKYLLADEVKAEWFSRTRITRDALLTIPDRIAPILAAEANEVEVRRLLLEEIHQALEELSQ